MNSELLTDLPYVTTQDNKPTVTTAAANIIVSIIASPTDGAAIGDFAVAFSEKLSDALNKIATDVEAMSCSVKKRVACQRASEFAKRVYEALINGELTFVQDFPTVMVSAPDVAAIVGFIASARARAIVSLAVSAYLVSKVLGKLPSVFKLMKDMAVAGGGDNESCPPFELTCNECKGNLLSICIFPWAGCPCKKTEDCPNPQQDCEDDRCQGDSDDFCTKEHKGCTCQRKEG